MSEVRFGAHVRALTAALAVLLLPAVGRCGEAASGGVLFARTPLSVAEQGSGGLYGSFDIFKVFQNPAIMAWQPAPFEVGAAAQTQFGGDQQLWALAGGWAEDYGNGGSFGVAALASGLRAASFDELDLSGNPTGTQVAPAGFHLGAAAFYQYAFLSLGAGIHLGGASYGSQLADGIQTGMNFLGADFGVMARLGRVDLGVRIGEWDSVQTGFGEVSFGGAIRTSGWFKGAVSVLVSGPLGIDNLEQDPSTSQPETDGGLKARVEGGVTWEAVRFITVRAGVATPGAGATIRAGFTVPYRSLALDYALSMPTGSVAAMGSSHLLGVRWNAGGERKQWVKRAPRELTFVSTEKERTMAVANLDPQNVSAGDAAVIADLLRNELVREGTFNIVEKANMDMVLQEQAFQQTGCTTQECAVKLGKVLNVRFLVVGGFGKVLDQFLVSMRVVDVESGRIIYSDTTQGTNLGEVQTGIRGLAMRLTEAVKREK